MASVSQKLTGSRVPLDPMGTGSNSGTAPRRAGEPLEIARGAKERMKERQKGGQGEAGGHEPRGVKGKQPNGTPSATAAAATPSLASGSGNKGEAVGEEGRKHSEEGTEEHGAGKSSKEKGKKKKKKKGEAATKDAKTEAASRKQAPSEKQRYGLGCWQTAETVSE